MRRIQLTLLLSAVPALVVAQPAAESYTPPPPPPAGVPAVQAPSMPQPPPPQVAQPPQVYQEAPQQPVAAPEGQWVNTNQYGWIWIPYAQEYTYIPGDAQVYPDQYVYYPAYGWRWVVAPWVYGYGPAPYWGAFGATTAAGGSTAAGSVLVRGALADGLERPPITAPA
jgi:hypothetical protein